MSPVLTNRLAILKDRSYMLMKARSFFAERGIMEVDVPHLSKSACIDAYIDLIGATCMNERCFLHSSPEYGMKRLLAEGVGDIFQLAHVFREGDLGRLHNPEFTMAEWYRIGFSFDEMIEETLEFCALFFDFDRQYEKIGYKDLFMRHLGFFPTSIEERFYRFAFEIEKHLGINKPTVIVGFPESQAALSKIGADGMAERFEIYFSGFELANGYHELLDAEEQRKRLLKANQIREEQKKEVYPLDENFLEALLKGIDDCCGVACGFDRLMMLRHKAESIEKILPFGWETS